MTEKTKSLSKLKVQAVPKRKKVTLSIPIRSCSMFFRTTPKVRDWYAHQATLNKCDMVDVFENIANLFMDKRIQVLPEKDAAPSKKHLVAG